LKKLVQNRVKLFQLSKTDHFYDNKQTLSNISLSINRGEKIALVGASGVGKTTLLNLLIEQKPLNIAFCAQGKHLIENLSAYNNIYMGQLENFSLWKNLINLIKPNKESLSEINQIASRLFIKEQLFSSVKNLSGGQKQRVAIGRAFFQNKDIFIGDEVTSNLDSELADKLLKEIVSNHQTCIVAIHDKQLALKHFDRVIGLKQGKIEIDAQSSKLQQADIEFLY